MRPFTKWDWSLNWANNLSNIFLANYPPGVIGLDDEGDDNGVDGFADNVDAEEESEVMEDGGYKYYDENRNHHPFKLGGFTLIHNGVISNAQSLHNEYNFRTNISTDSYIILELIDYFFKRSSIKDRIKRISTAIQDTCEKLKGRYSVVLYDKKGKNTFYFKNSMTSFSFCKYGDSILCGSTSYENLKYVYFGMDRENIHIKNKRVYLITSSKTSPVVDVSPREHKSAESKTLYDILLDEVDYEEKIRKMDIFLEKSLGFLPYYEFSLKGHLKIAGNNTYGIKEKIYSIVDKPRKHFGWYIIKASDVKPLVKVKKIKVKKIKVKLKKSMKGGKK